MQKCLTLNINILPHLIIIDILDNKIKENELVNIYDISKFLDNSDLDKKMATLATKAE